MTTFLQVIISVFAINACLISMIMIGMLLMIVKSLKVYWHCVILGVELQQ